MTGPMSETDLLKVWVQGSARAMWERVRDAAVTEDDVTHAELAESELRVLPAPLVALAANVELVRALTGRRWYVMQLALEDGASWADVAQALECTPQEAVTEYSAAIAVQELYAGPLHDVARARAVLPAGHLREGA